MFFILLLPIPIEQPLVRGSFFRFYRSEIKEYSPQEVILSLKWQKGMKENDKPVKILHSKA